jgi:hypothetical protein
VIANDVDITSTRNIFPMDVGLLVHDPQYGFGRVTNRGKLFAEIVFCNGIRTQIGAYHPPLLNRPLSSDEQAKLNDWAAEMDEWSPQRGLIVDHRRYGFGQITAGSGESIKVKFTDASVLSFPSSPSPDLVVLWMDSLVACEREMARSAKGVRQLHRVDYFPYTSLSEDRVLRETPPRQLQAERVGTWVNGSGREMTTCPVCETNVRLDRLHIHTKRVHSGALQQKNIARKRVKLSMPARRQKPPKRKKKKRNSRPPHWIFVQGGLCNGR